MDGDRYCILRDTHARTHHEALERVGVLRDAWMHAIHMLSIHQGSEPNLCECVDDRLRDEVVDHP